MLFIFVLTLSAPAFTEVEHPIFSDDAVHLKCKSIEQLSDPRVVTIIPSSNASMVWNASIAHWSPTWPMSTTLRDYSFGPNGILTTISRSSLAMEVAYGPQFPSKHYQCRISSLEDIDDYVKTNFPTPKI